MLRPMFAVSVDLRHRVGESLVYIVTGACEPPGFDSNANARQFVQREIAKYRNGSMLPFKPTHMILWQPATSPEVKRKMPVRMIETSERRTGIWAALYKEDDWAPCIIPDWNYNKAVGRLTLDGVLMGLSWKLMTYEEGLVTDDIWGL